MLHHARFSLLAFLAAALPAQSPCFELNLGTDLLLTDDSTAQGLQLGFTFNFANVGYTAICVCSNGFIWLGPTSVAGGDYTPTEAELLSGAPRICPLWEDFNPSIPGSGHIYFNAVPASGSTPAYALITWAGVYEFGRTGSPISFQVRMDANSNIRIVYGANVPIGGTTNTQMLIGASPGNNSPSNPVVFAPRPFTITQDNFDQVIPSTAFPYAGVSMQLIHTSPGYQGVDVPCSPNSFPGPAQFARFGQGCPMPPTVYELFDTATNLIDLSNLNFTYLPSGNSYIVTQGIAGPMFTGLSNNLGAGDDTTHAVTLPFPFPYNGGVLNSIVVSSNGFLYLSAIDGGAGCCGGTVAGLLTGQPRIAAHWSDLYTSPGGVYADHNAVAGEFCVTWSGVSEFGAPSASNTFQIALKNNGGIDVRYGNVMLVSHVSLAGYSAGINAIDPGPTDLSTITALPLPPGGTPLDLNNVNNGVPQFGTTMQLQVSRLRTGGTIAFLVLGYREALPPIDMSPFGAAGCNSYLDFLTAPIASQFALTGGGTTASFGIPIPNNPAFSGINLLGQSLGDDPTANPLGFRFSNAVRMTVGS